MKFSLRFFLYCLLLVTSPSFASSDSLPNLNMMGSTLGVLALVIFTLAYILVVAEEFIHLRKSKPVIMAAGIIWVLVALLAKEASGGEVNNKELIDLAIQHNLMEYASLFLFLLTAMVYVNAMTERNIFEALRGWMVQNGFSYRQLFWLTGLLAFFISPVADNLTTALLMGTVIMTLGSDQKRFVSLGFLNIVIAANAGGAFSPFGDITTLMVWQSGHVDFFTFFNLFIPSVVNYLIPAVVLSRFIPNGRPSTLDEVIEIKPGGLIICCLFVCTIATAVAFEQALHLPPFLGMMLGLSYLFIFSYYLMLQDMKNDQVVGEFNIFNKVAKAEWDTLLFFFGIIFCVGGLGAIGYLAYVSHMLYDLLGATTANIIVGMMSAVVDNIPVMFAILSMNPQMDTYQWLLVTMTAGVGGSLLSIGSAAGVALMGQSRGMYTFFSHLRWSWLIGIGYAAGIYTHYLING